MIVQTAVALITEHSTVVVVGEDFDYLVPMIALYSSFKTSFHETSKKKSLPRVMYV